jgi:hypothetical protein
MVIDRNNHIIIDDYLYHFYFLLQEKVSSLFINSLRSLG